MKQLTHKQLEMVKQEHPEWFPLKDGKWYAHVSNGFPLIFKTGDKSGYGFFGEPNKFHWCDESNTWSFEQEPESWREATQEEIEHALIKEAKRRYKKGDKIKGNVPLYSAQSNSMVIDGDVEVTPQYSIWARSTNDFHIALFKDGIWAEVISTPTIHDDIQSLKDKYPDYNITIIAEKK